MFKKLILIAALFSSSLFAANALQLELLWKNGEVRLISKKQITAELKKQRGTTLYETIKASEFSFIVKDKLGQALLEQAMRHPGILHLDIPENTKNHSSEHKEIVQDSVLFTLIIPMNKEADQSIEFWQNLKFPNESPASRLQRISVPTIQKVGEIQL